jgi:hypothetical protein
MNLDKDGAFYWYLTVIAFVCALVLFVGWTPPVKRKASLSFPNGDVCRTEGVVDLHVLNDVECRDVNHVLLFNVVYDPMIGEIQIQDQNFAFLAGTKPAPGIQFTCGPTYCLDLRLGKYEDEGIDVVLVGNTL